MSNFNGPTLVLTACVRCQKKRLYREKDYQVTEFDICNGCERKLRIQARQEAIRQIKETLQDKGLGD